MIRMASEHSADVPGVVGSPRLEWAELPSHVRDAVNGLLGSAVVRAANQSGGFSPGLAARVRCADGSRAFVKAVGAEINPDSPDLYRAEARVAAALPAEIDAPALRGMFDDGEWIALVFDEIDGRMPAAPWHPDELRRVIHAVAGLSRALTPCPVAAVPPASQALRSNLLAFTRLATDPPGDLGGWALRHLDRLAELAATTLDHVDGDTLVHCDLRGDNMLLAPDGRVWFVDWPWAFRGAAWIDTAVLLVNVALHGHDPEPYLDGNPLFVDADPLHVTGLLAGLAGMFAEASRRPDPPGLPTVRAFQRAQEDVTLAWVRRRTGWT